MNAWLQFLRQHGAYFDNNQPAQIAGFDGRPDGQAPKGFVAPLTDLGLISASGEDAANFLHSQLTNDIEHLDASQARLAGYCSPKGRLLATLLLWKAGDAILLEVPRQILPALHKRLQMFVLRAKAKLIDASDEQVVLGIGGQAAADSLKTWFPILPETPLTKVESEAGILIRFTDAFGSSRFQWITNIATAERAFSQLSENLTPVGPHIWRLAEIHAGIPQITQTTQEQFVPQMINFEVIGGVNFKKGCYPGQEIVARSQYLGKLKRRMLPASTQTTDVQAGMEVFSSEEPEQPCGMVVNAERSLEGGSDCLVEIKLASTSSGSIHLGAVDGPQLTLGTLPYSLPA